MSVRLRPPALSAGGRSAAGMPIGGLAADKCPRRIRIIEFADFPRSASGQMRRHEPEARLAKESAPERGR